MGLRALVVEDHPLLREALRTSIISVVPDADVSVAATLAEAIEHPTALDLVTLDLGLSDAPGILQLPLTIARFAPAPVLVVTGASHAGVEAHAAASGAAGYVSKKTPIEIMIQAIKTVTEGGRWFSDSAAEKEGAEVTPLVALASLTPAQHRILEAMKDGRLNKQIAFDLGLSEITVKSHVKAILNKLGVSNRTQAVLMLRDTQP